jgi:hypothetical protein
MWMKNDPHPSSLWMKIHLHHLVPASYGHKRMLITSDNWASSEAILIVYTNGFLSKGCGI